MRPELDYKVPKDWGSDPLSLFIENVRRNTLATFANLKPLFAHLGAVDRVYRDIIDNLHNTPDWFAAFFLFRAHCSYLASLRLSLSGQVAESYPILRSCIEAPLYGLYMTHKPDSRFVWANRHDDEKSRNACRNEFAVGKLLSVLKSVDKKIHSVVSQLYNRTIDLGGHPNEKSIFSNLRRSDSEDFIRFDLIYLATDGPTLRASLLTTAQVGIVVLDVFGTIFRERFDLLGLSHRLDELKKSV